MLAYPVVSPSSAGRVGGGQHFPTVGESLSQARPHRMDGASLSCPADLAALLIDGITGLSQMGFL